MNVQGTGAPGPKRISCPDRLAGAFQEMLARFFETKSEAFLETARRQVAFLEVPQGALLIEEGGSGDDIFFVLSGRLRAVKAARGGDRMLGEIGRGEVIGELAMLLEEPRSASIFAVRDSLVAMLPRCAFEAALEEEPRLALSVARGAVRRYRMAEKMRQPPRKPVTVCLEHELFDGEGPAPSVFQTLVLFHDRTIPMPSGTAAWLRRRPVHRHFHIRRGHAPDIRRIARTLAGRAVGYVLAGGGARAFVHFGVINALSDFGIEPDFLGGTSMGATAAAWRAMDLTGPDFVSAGRKVYLSKPTSDINFLPMMSLVRGHKVRRISEQAVEDVAGRQADIEDLWLPYYCIATNMSAAMGKI